MRLVLASSSPRRKQLLAEAGLAFEVVVPDVEEVRRPDETPDAFALRAARDKAGRVAQSLADEEPCIVLGADTIVVDGDLSLGKPGHAEAARQMLEHLSGRTHQVLTGVCLQPVPDSPHTPAAGFVVCTSVTFRSLSAQEIDAYIATGEPFDKAGAYGIQGHGGALVDSISGSYSNVVGLPVEDVLLALRLRFGWPP